MDRVVHFEIPADDLARARDFYGSVFEWGLQVLEEMDYTIVQTTSTDETSQLPKEPGAINGGMMARSAETTAPVITVGVDAIDHSLKKIEAAGGSVVTPRTEIPGMGAYAYFKDSEGNVLGLWENA